MVAILRYSHKPVSPTLPRTVSPFPPSLPSLSHLITLILPDTRSRRYRFDHDPRWAETGDRYLIKLFRDFVFHQVDESGRPVTDLSHVLTQLNKLDSGVEEKLMLVSRDEGSCLIVSYREVSFISNSVVVKRRIRG